MVIELKVNQDEQIKSSGKTNTDNNDNNKVNSNENQEHQRRLLLTILRERQIVTDSKTGKLINDDTDTQTLLRIIQEEKEKDGIKTKDLPEASINTVKLPWMREILQYYAIPYNLWHRSYCSVRDLTCELTMVWLLLLAMNPLTGWFFHPFLFGWIQ